jgi:predicted lipoprotein with Yx(FWY)xxD motif
MTTPSYPSKPFGRNGFSLLPLAATAVGVLLLTAACGGSSGTGSTASTTSTTSTTSKPAAAGAPAAAGLSTAHTAAGTILVDGKGRTLYAFAADKKGTSNCNGSCATYWPPVQASTAPPAPSGVTATLGVVKRADGTSQLTAGGWPLYTYIGDTKPGAITGQGKNLDGGLWWVVDPTGKWIMKTGGANTAQSGY